ncbi:MAG: hypothetical protein ACK4GD_02180 [Sphingomonadaceae bacterium]
MDRAALPLAALAAPIVGSVPAAEETVYIKADRLLKVETGKYVDAPLVTVSGSGSCDGGSLSYGADRFQRGYPEFSHDRELPAHGCAVRSIKTSPDHA